MNIKTYNKINFLTKLDEKLDAVKIIASFLVEEHFIEQFRYLQILSMGRSQRVADLLSELDSLPSKQVMVDWSWMLLPEERLVLTIVGRKNVKVIEWAE